MAQKIPATADETLAGLIECGICLLEMKNPKALSCLHSFCLECLKQVKRPRGIFSCPLCKEQMVLPSEGVDGLRDNFFINQLKDWKAIQKIEGVKTSCACCKSTDHSTKACCIKSATLRQTEEIKTLVSNCKGLSTQLKDAIDETEEVKNNLKKDFCNIQKKLDEEKKAFIEAIQRSYEANTERLAQIQKEQLEKINSTRQGLDFIQSKLVNAMEIGSQVGSIGRKFGDRNGRWIFERDIGKQGDTTTTFSIALSPHGCFLADDGTRSIKTFDQAGNLKQEIRGNLAFPKDIALTSSGIYVADKSTHIKLFSYNGNYVKGFPAISPDGTASDCECSCSELHGVATDNDGNILVGNKYKKYISKHRPDGTHISSFPIDMNPRFLRVTANGRIVVTHYQGNSSPYIFDSKGNRLGEINRPNCKEMTNWRWGPTGIACSDDGSIFIATFSDGIYHFTEDGEYVGCVTKDVEYAYGLDIYDDKLVVAQRSGRPAKLYTYQEV